MDMDVLVNQTVKCARQKRAFIGAALAAGASVLPHVAGHVLGDMTVKGIDKLTQKDEQPQTAPAGGKGGYGPPNFGSVHSRDRADPDFGNEGATPRAPVAGFKLASVPMGTLAGEPPTGVSNARLMQGIGATMGGDALTGAVLGGANGLLKGDSVGEVAQGALTGGGAFAGMSAGGRTGAVLGHRFGSMVHPAGGLIGGMAGGIGGTVLGGIGGTRLGRWLGKGLTKGEVKPQTLPAEKPQAEKTSSLNYARKHNANLLDVLTTVEQKLFK